jgi:CheY-like chemotaxis protein
MASKNTSSPIRRCMRVLLVDDCEDAVSVLETLLQLEGHDVRTCGDGGAALSEARSFRPEVMVLDLHLPGVSGVEVARRIRAEPQDAPCPLLIAATGQRQFDLDASAQRLFDHFLTKPLAVDVLCELIVGARSSVSAENGAH